MFEAVDVARRLGSSSRARETTGPSSWGREGEEDGRFCCFPRGWNKTSSSSSSSSPGEDGGRGGGSKEGSVASTDDMVANSLREVGRCASVSVCGGREYNRRRRR